MKTGDTEIYRCLFDSYYETLVLFANHFLDDPEAAEDVVQDCFVDFWTNRRLDNFTDHDVVERYIYASVKHAALNYLRTNERRDRRHMALAREMSEDADDRNGMSDEEVQYLYQAINRLPEERRHIFTLICIEGKKYQEVADMLDISINTVKTQMGRAFQFLRQSLDKGRFALFMFLLLKFKD